MHNTKQISEARRLLFIGNSATYVHDIPGTLCRLAGDAGYRLEATPLVKGGFTLAEHADCTSEWGRGLLCEIAKKYDAVFLQDNGNCIASEGRMEASREACAALGRAIGESGGECFIYVRPPYGTENAGRAPLEQCIGFDCHFGGIAREIGAGCVYVNRAFACAMTELDFDLWGPDHAHTSERGAYLAVCVFFATVFGVTSAALGANGLPEEDARKLQSVADRIALGGYVPWRAGSEQ